MKKATFTINGYKLRLDQIKTISPLYTRTTCLDEWMQLFMRDSKLSMQSQYYFIITFIGKSGSYQEFNSKVVNYVGRNNFKGDEEFAINYNQLVADWEEYHNNLSQIL